MTIPVWPEPPIDLTLTLDVAAYAADEENLLMPVERSWRYGGVGTGKFEPATFQSNVLGSGTASLGIGFKDSDGKPVATLEAEGQLTFGISKCACGMRGWGMRGVWRGVGPGGWSGRRVAGPERRCACAHGA